MKKQIVSLVVFLKKKKKQGTSMLLSPAKKEEKKVANGLLLIFFKIFFFFFINYVMLLYLKSFALALVDEFRNFAFYRIIGSDWREKSRVLAVVKRRESRMEKEKKNKWTD